MSVRETLIRHQMDASEKEKELTRKIIDFLDEQDLLHSYGADMLSNALKTAAAIADMWAGRGRDSEESAEVEP